MTFVVEKFIIVEIKNQLVANSVKLTPQYDDTIRLETSLNNATHIKILKSGELFPDGNMLIKYNFYQHNYIRFYSKKDAMKCIPYYLIDDFTIEDYFYTILSIYEHVDIKEYRKTKLESIL